MIDNYDVRGRVAQSQSQIEASQKNLLRRFNVSFINDATCAKTEKILNAIIYPKENPQASQGVSALADTIKDLFLQRAKEMLNAKFDEFRFDQHVFSDKRSAEGKISRNTYESFSHSNHIMAQTVRDRIKAAREKLDEMGKTALLTNNMPVDPDSLEAQFITIINQGNALLNQYGDGLVPEEIKITPATADLVASLDHAYELASIAQSLPLTTNQIGLLWEEVLTVVAKGLKGEEIADDILEKLTTQGTQTVFRGGTDLLKVNGYTLDSVSSSSKNGESAPQSYVLTSPTGSKIEVNNVLTKKQSKADVTIHLGDVPLRVSAKNWSQLSGHDFGHTSLAAALIRSSGLNDTLLYGLGLSWHEDWQPYLNENLFHNYAYIAIVADIVAGISQGNANSANTIIINDRSEGRVRVYSVRSLINKIAELGQGAENYITGYHGEALRKNIMQQVAWGNHYIDHNGYEQTIINILQGIDVSVSSSLLPS